MKKEDLKKEIAKISVSALVAAISFSPLMVNAGEGSSCGKGSCGQGGEEIVAEGEEIVEEGEEIVEEGEEIVEE